jgi:hypothetical protein
MRLNVRAAPLLLAALAMAACRESPAPAAPASAAPTAALAGAVSPATVARSGGAGSGAASTASDGSYRRVIDVGAATGRPALQFTLVAASAPGEDGILRLSAIEVRHAGSAELLQRLDGLDTQTPTTAGAPVLEQIDLDFDGTPDIRVIESLPAGPNVPYRNWRYDRASARFVACPELDEVASPVFDAERREVRSRPAAQASSRSAATNGRAVAGFSTARERRANPERLFGKQAQSPLSVRPRQSIGADGAQAHHPRLPGLAVGSCGQLLDPFGREIAVLGPSPLGFGGELEVLVADRARHGLTRTRGRDREALAILGFEP